ncbi:STI1-like protein [Tribolium madens]|uniref:STI1-like protein n=1 Tax=Tribolium madens TaxID=41895 RepID=UPI001CF76775|nr:STI1-like protein [Tribolium madens]
MDESPEALKELGNTAVKNQKYEEAILYYTQALKSDSNNYTLYSNRSLAFLKVQQYYFAMQDANETIRLNPNWPKGYFRKAEVEYSAKRYLEACESYQKALNLKPDDVNIMGALSRAKRQILKERKADEVIPWLGAGIGIVIGVIIVIADCIFTHKPTHPLLMAFVTIIIAMVGYGVAKTYRYYVRCQNEGLLEPPPDLMSEGGKDETVEKETKHTPRYTKSQARQRYKKGKL